MDIGLLHRKQMTMEINNHVSNIACILENIKESQYRVVMVNQNCIMVEDKDTHEKLILAAYTLPALHGLNL